MSEKLCKTFSIKLILAIGMNWSVRIEHIIRLRCMMRDKCVQLSLRYKACFRIVIKYDIENFKLLWALEYITVF